MYYKILTKPIISYSLTTEYLTKSKVVTVFHTTFKSKSLKTHFILIQLLKQTSELKINVFSYQNITNIKKITFSFVVDTKLHQYINNSNNLINKNI